MSKQRNNKIIKRSMEELVDSSRVLLSATKMSYTLSAETLSPKKIGGNTLVVSMVSWLYLHESLIQSFLNT